MTYLILVRHGQSEWNEKGLWTGLTDIGLNEKGRDEARKTAEAIADLPIDEAYTSSLIRAKETLEIILKKRKLSVPITTHSALNERDYGVYTGKNKWEVKEALGEAVFQKLRRSFDYPIQNGESLKQVCERVIPYYQSEILPKLISGKNILVSAHGNSIRALVKYLENISDEDISNVEVRTGEALVYKLGADGKIEGKETRAENAVAV